MTREAYSDEVISLGFWAGDANVPEAAYYAYAAPEPAGVRDVEPPAGARWTETGLVLLPYETVRTAPDPRRALLEFLEGSYGLLADAAGWERGLLDNHRGSSI